MAETTQASTRFPVISATDTRPRSRYGRWRAATLILVYVAMVVHIVHWYVAGKTLAPLELNEVMYTLELGIVTAGFLFMLVAILATAVFGRFFCSWGCHILALQDLCEWILEKFRIRPKGVRSRVLLWVPVIAMLYMFAWPQLKRLWEGHAMPILHLTTDAEGWASFATEDFWRNLPGPGVIVATFLICGFVIVYVLGSRGFCNYGCPYGAIFGWADRIAPGRIRVGDDCIQCATCTAVCNSHIRVHEELNRYGTVVNPACMKDLDCVSACPQQSLHYGFGRPSLIRKVQGDKKVRRSYDFALWEEIVMAVVFVAVLLVYRGLYDFFPFLMTLGMGAIIAYLVIVQLRLLRLGSVKFNRWFLKREGRMLGRGWGFATVMTIVIALTMHSGFIRYHTHQGTRSYNLTTSSESGRVVAQAGALSHLGFVQRWGLVRSNEADKMIADVYVQQEQWGPAARVLNRVLDRRSGDGGTLATMARIQAGQGKLDEAIRYAQAVVELAPKHAQNHYHLAGFQFKAGNLLDARQHLETAIKLDPDFAEAHFELGAVLIELSELVDGISHLRRCTEIMPDHADAYYNLGVALAMTGRLLEAQQPIAIARKLNPDDEQTAAFQPYLQSLIDARIRGVAQQGR